MCWKVFVRKKCECLWIFNIMNKVVFVMIMIFIFIFCRVMLYGGVGFIMGYELIYGFDVDGKLI